MSSGRERLPGSSTLDAVALRGSLAVGGLDASGIRAVESHVDACASCAEVLSQLIQLYASAERDRALALGSSHERVALARTVAAPNAAAPAAPRAIGRYRILGLLGEGAMGAVYAAHDPELDRAVALKVLRPDPFADPGERRARLGQEAQAMARLAHPNVVAVFDVGVDASTGQLFVAMEHVHGATLGAWMRALPAGKRREAEIFDVFAQAGRGLAAAHAAGLVHRDFKPENVLYGADGRARVSDFGLARRPRGGDQGAGAAALAETRAGALVGTPAYMAPEQLRGATADARSDQFAFAVALFEALTGERPFEGRTLAELTANVLAGRTTPALARLAAPQRALFARALAVDPGARFPSMDALLAEMDRGRAPRASPMRIVGYGALALALAAGAATGVYFATRTDRPPEREPARTVAPPKAKVWPDIDPPPTEAASEEALAIVEALEALDADLAGWDLTPARAKVSALVARARALAYDPVIAEALVVAARVERALDRPKQAKEMLEEAARLARATRHDELLYDATIALVEVSGVELGDAKECETWIGLAEAEAKRRPDDVARRATLDLAIGRVRRRRGMLDEAAPPLDSAVALREQEVGTRSLELADALLARADLALARGRAASALEDAERARGIAVDRAVVRDGPEMVRFEVGRAAALLASAKVDDAIAALEAAIRTADTYGQGRAPVVLVALDLRARAALAKGDAAGPYADRASMGMLVERGGKLSCHDPSGSSRTSGAIDFAARIRSKVEKPDDTHHVSEENAQACARATEGDEPGALATIGAALVHADQNPTTAGGTLGALHYNRALLLLRSGDLASATTEVDLARGFTEREVGVDHVRWALVELLRGRLLKRLGSPDAERVTAAARALLVARRGEGDALVQAATAPAAP